MIGRFVDSMVSTFSPSAGVRRAQARKLLRSYSGAESNRLTSNKSPKNQAADSELLGPFGADQLRAWARMLVRDNAYAWGVVDTIVSSVVGLGINAQSMMETPAGDDIENVNETRDSVWAEWCEVCDINGQLTFSEIQQLAQREMVEAGECLIHLVNTPGKTHRGIYRPVPLAIELIEADRLASDKDTYAIRSSANRVIRGVELDELGKPVAYWIYPEHPSSPYVTRNTTPQRIEAKHIRHLYRRDRIGQSRGASWFAPVMSWIRDLGVYVDNEIQASAVASCFGVAIKTDGPSGSGLMPSTSGDSTDDNGNTFEHLEPAMIVRLGIGESIESINPGRPNSASEPWINLMLRGIAVGTGLSYEIVARDYSQVSYSSSRTSQLEDRRRFRRWQRYLVNHLCQPVWDRFCEQAATSGHKSFPTMTEILDDRRGSTTVEWQTTEWEWVDPQSEQTASQAAIDGLQSTLQSELGTRGKNWRQVLYQQAKEKKLKESLGLITPTEAMAESQLASADGGESGESENIQAAALNGAQVTSMVDVITQVGTGAMPKDTAKAILQAAFPLIDTDVIDNIIDPIEPGAISADGTPAPVEAPTAASTATGEMMGLSTLQFNRNRKAIAKILAELAAGESTEGAARVFLSSVGMSTANVDALIADAMDGTVDTEIPEAASVE